jgi:aspartate/methionine/tyrosine aminotransferase
LFCDPDLEAGMALTGKTIGAMMEAPIQRLKEMARGRDVLSFAQGVPWFGPPEAPLSRALERLRSGEGHGYSHDPGRESLREGLAADLRNRGIPWAATGTVMATPGANQAVYIALATLADRGDEVILFRPYYFNNLMALQLLGLKPVLVDAGPNGAIDVEMVRRRITRRTRALIVVSPGNPGGAMVDRAGYQGLLALAVEHRFYLISDEAYRDFAWEEPHLSPLAMTGENVIGVFSFSKSYGMAGWRLGFLNASEAFIAQAVKAADTLHICPPLPAQILAEEVLAAEPGYPQRFRPDMKESRDRLIAALQPLGERGLTGELRSAGGFYLFVRFTPNHPWSGWELARQLIEEHGMAALPGEPFGMEEEPYLRLSYGNIRSAEMKTFAPRLAAALGELLGR